MVYGKHPEPYFIQVSARAVLECPTVTAMESLISDILRLRPDDQQSVRSNQVLRHCTLNYPHDVVLKLSHLAGTCSDPQITIASISVLSTLLTKSGCQIMPEILTDLKAPLLSCSQNTAGPISRGLVPVLINVASRIIEASGEEWTEFLDYEVLSSLGKEKNLEAQEPALTVLSIFPAKLLHQLKRFDLCAVWSTVLLQVDSMKDEAIVSDMVTVNMEADEWRKRYAGVCAISAVVNSTNEVVNKYLEQFVQILSKSLCDVSADVRWAASSTIRRFSTQFIQYHERILPALTTSLVDFESDVLKGTTNFGFIHDGGVALGADSRISNTTRNYIVRDDFIKVRRIRGNFQGTIYCTLAGSVKPWLKLYNHLNNKITVTSIEDALDKAKVFLHQYVRDNSKRLDKKVAFGMLIGGYTQTEGHRLGVVYLWRTEVYMSIRDSAETLGSGAKFANEILSRSAERQAYGEEKIMTTQQALDLGFQTLCYATTHDKYSGGSSHVVHIHEHDIEEHASTSLDSYKAHYGDIEKRSLFLLHVRPYPIWTDKDMKELLGIIWPNGEVTYHDLEAHHFLAKRLDIHIHRFLFKDEQTATEAYTQVNQVAYLPDRGPHDTLEDQFVVRGFVRRCGTRQDPVYVGPSSFQFLTHMCRMRQPSSLKYPFPPWF